MFYIDRQNTQNHKKNNFQRQISSKLMKTKQKNETNMKLHVPIRKNNGKEHSL